MKSELTGKQMYCNEVAPKVSICLDCARHTSLKRAINEKQSKGLCGFCERPDVIIGDPDDSTALIMLVRSLLRFFWSENEYNPHWGGDDPIYLLKRENNPIVAPPKSDLYHDTLNDELFTPGYFDPNKGISIYEGFFEEMRLMSYAISTTPHPDIDKIKQRLLHENFFEVEPALEKLLSPFIEELADTLPAGNIWFRARLGQKQKFLTTDGFDCPIYHQPWQDVDIGAPPPPLAGNGRLNRAGVSALYLASNIETAIAEIRPHPGHFVSVGGFHNTNDLRIANFNADIFDFSINDIRLNYYHIINHLDNMMSFPVVPEEKNNYHLTQLLGEILRRKGFDGIKFKSSVEDGENICIFDSKKFSFIKGYSNVLKVNKLKYSYESSPTTIDPPSHEILLQTYN